MHEESFLNTGTRLLFEIFFCKNDPYLNIFFIILTQNFSELAHFGPFGSNPFLQMAHIVIQVGAVFSATLDGTFQLCSSHVDCIDGPIGH